MTGRNFEQATTPESDKILFDDIEENDLIVFQTVSGSTYRLQAGEIIQGRRAVTMYRESDHSVRNGSFPIEIDKSLRFNLRGSCSAVIGSGAAVDLAPVDPVEGRFIVGERAWMGVNTEGIFITSPIESLELVKAD